MSDRTPKKTPKRGPKTSPLGKLLSNPINIGRPNRLRTGNKALPRTKKLMAQSVPAHVRYHPPKAPTLRPRLRPEEDIPPIELPPSPPLFTQSDVQAHLERERKKREKADELFLAAPVSRSLNEYHWTMSLPNHVGNHPFQPNFHNIQEDTRNEEKLAVGSRPAAASFSQTSSTIFSILHESATGTSNSGDVSPHSATRSLSYNKDGDNDLDDDLQFSISLRDDEESQFLNAGGNEQTQFQFDLN